MIGENSTAVKVTNALEEFKKPSTKMTVSNKSLIEALAMTYNDEGTLHKGMYTPGSLPPCALTPHRSSVTCVLRII